MKAYIASHECFLAHNTAELIASNGVEITSRWHSKDFLPTSNHTEDECIAIAVEDVEDISRADILVLIAGPDRYSGGKFVEAGIAFGQNKPVIVIGRRENMLLWHPAVMQFNNIDDAMTYIVQLTLDHIS